MYKLLKLILLLAFLIFTPFFNNVYAQNNASERCDPKIYPNGCPVTKENFNPSFQTDLALANLINSLGCLGIGMSVNGQGCGAYNFNTGFVHFDYIPSGGALGILASGITFMLAQPPISAVQYTADVIRNGLNIGKPAYAQGVGGSGIGVVAPIQRLWQTSRNIAYLGFTIIFIAVGFMVMFRQKLDAQTVVSVQSALPGLVIGLILVTFSYLIVGLIVDLAFISSQVVGVAIVSSLDYNTSSGNPSPNTRIISILNDQNIISLFSNFIVYKDLHDASEILDKGVNGIFGAGWGTTLKVTMAYIMCPFAKALCGLGTAFDFGDYITDFASGIGAGIEIPSNVVAFLFFAILVFSIIAALFRLFLNLIGAYVSIILYTIFGPFLILFSTIPGRSHLFTEWLLGLLGNVLVFPAVFGLFALVAGILSTTPAGADTAAQWGFKPILPGTSTDTFTQALPLFGGFPQDIIRFIIAYGMLLAAPGVPNYIKQLLAKPAGAELGQAAEQSASSGAGGVMAILSRI